MPDRDASKCRPRFSGGFEVAVLDRLRHLRLARVSGGDRPLAGDDLGLTRIHRFSRVDDDRRGSLTRHANRSDPDAA